MGHRDAHRARSLCRRDRSCCLGTLLHEASCPAPITVAALHPAFLPAAHPHRHLGAPPGHLLAWMFRTPPTITSFRSCWFSSFSSMYLVLLSCRAMGAPCSACAAPLFSLLTSRIRLEAEEQRRVRAQTLGPGLPLSAPGPETTVTPSPRTRGLGWSAGCPPLSTGCYCCRYLRAPQGVTAPLLPQLVPGREATQS